MGDLELVVELPGSPQKPATIGDRLRLGWALRDVFVVPVQAAVE